MTNIDSDIVLNICSKSNEELFVMLNYNPQDYTEDALNVANKEFVERKISNEETNELKFLIERLSHEEVVKSELSATVSERLTSFLFPIGLLNFMKFRNIRDKGFVKKADQLQKASNYGILFYVALIALALMS